MSSTSRTHSSWGSPHFVLFVLLPFLVACFLLYEIYTWMSQHGGGLWIIGIIAALGVVSLTWASWKIRNAWLAHKRVDDVRRLEAELLGHQVRQQEYRAAMLEEEASTRKTSRQLMEETLLLMQEARRKGHNVNMEYAPDGTVKRIQTIAARAAQRMSLEEIEDVADDVPQLQAPLPKMVRYEDVRSQVPAGHVLVGMGRAGLETREAAIGACLWIVGGSGTGKTSSTTVRVEERAAAGHSFLGIDPHFFKPDSLTNGLKAYESSFLMPMARTPEEMKQVLTAFLEEFRGRKSGQIAQPWQPITLLVDEVNALMDPADELEEEIARMLKTIARICGQESRNFNMGGIFISQQATELAWLRKVALMIIVHQLNMESEKKIALQNDREAMEDMKRWPVGRTYVYGIGFQEGPRTVQQPYFSKVVDASIRPAMEELPQRQSEPLHVSRTTPLQGIGNAPETPWETATEALSDDMDDMFGNTDELSSEKNEAPVSEEILKTIVRMKKDGMVDRKIAPLVGLGGRKYGLYQQAIDYLEGAK